FGWRGRNRDSSGGTMSLEAQTKEKIYSRVCELVTRRHFDPGMNGANWEELSKARRDQILQSPNDEEFEKQIQDLLAELKTSHTGFATLRARRSPAATLSPQLSCAATSMAISGGCSKTFMKAVQRTPLVCVRGIF